MLRYAGYTFAVLHPARKDLRPANNLTDSGTRLFPFLAMVWASMDLADWQAAIVQSPLGGAGELEQLFAFHFSASQEYLMANLVGIDAELALNPIRRQFRSLVHEKESYFQYCQNQTLIAGQSKLRF